MRIAFFTLNAYDMLTGGHEGDAVGGAQLQQILIGQELAQRGHEVVFVEYDAQYKSEGTVDGIEIVTKPRPTGSEPARAVQAFLGTFRTLRRTKPDICYRRVLNFELLPIALYCSLFRVRFVYGFAHDTEVMDDPRMFSSGIKSTRLYKRLNRLALSSAEAAIAQNDFQYDRAVSRLNTAVTQIPNCYETDRAEPIAWEFGPPVVFWAARYHDGKQPELVVELARKLPDVTFVMAGGPGDDDIYERVEQSASTMDNLHVLGHVPFSEIDRYFSAASLFLNTSRSEGFPNTFLQAWAQGTPVASLNVDPNGILTAENVGFVADGNQHRLADEIRQVVTNEDNHRTMSRESQEYIQNNHTVERIADEYERVFLGEK